MLVGAVTLTADSAGVSVCVPCLVDLEALPWEGRRSFRAAARARALGGACSARARARRRGPRGASRRAGPHADTEGGQQLGAPVLSLSHSKTTLYERVRRGSAFRKLTSYTYLVDGTVGGLD